MKLHDALPSQGGQRWLTSLGWILVGGLVASQTAWGQVTLPNLHDFSQHADPGWSNYCAPTAGANLVYYFSQNGFISLRQTYPIGPGASADTGATDIIGGLTGPPPPATSLAGLMNTSLGAGTTPLNLRDGLDQYLEANDGDINPTWNTQWITTESLGGAALWNQMKTSINQGSGVILLMDWVGSPPTYDPESHNYDLPEGASTNPAGTDPLAHAVTMAGYDPSFANDLYVMDPANNLVGGVGSHNWTPGLGDKYLVTVNPSSLSVVVNGSAATIFGAVVTQPVPEIETFALYMASICFLFMVFRRVRRQ